MPPSTYFGQKLKLKPPSAQLPQQLCMSTYVPVITMALSHALETLSFCAYSYTTLTKGFQPFNLVSAGFSLQAQEAAATAADYNHISARGTLVQYTDIQAIQGRQNLVLPSSTSGVGMHICTAYILLATLLGHLHPFMVSM